jgi:hypothetical protein
MLWGDMSVGRIVRGANCPWGELSVGRIVHGVKCPRASCLWGELSLGRNVLWASCPWGERSGNRPEYMPSETDRDGQSRAERRSRRARAG